MLNEISLFGSQNVSSYRWRDNVCLCVYVYFRMKGVEYSLAIYHLKGLQRCTVHFKEHTCLVHKSNNNALITYNTVSFFSKIDIFRELTLSVGESHISCLRNKKTRQLLYRSKYYRYFLFVLP